MSRVLLLQRRLLSSSSSSVAKDKPFYVPMGDHHARRLRNTTLLASSSFLLVAGAELYGWNLPPVAPEDVTLWTQLTSGSLLHACGMAVSLVWLVANHVDARVTVSEMRVVRDDESGGQNDLLLIKPYNLLGRTSAKEFRFRLDDLEFQGYGKKPNSFFVKGTGETLGARRFFLFDRLSQVEELFGTHRKSGMLPTPPPPSQTSRETEEDSGKKYKGKRRRGF